MLTSFSNIFVNSIVSFGTPDTVQYLLLFRIPGTHVVVPLDTPCWSCSFSVLHVQTGARPHILSLSLQSPQHLGRGGLCIPVPCGIVVCLYWEHARHSIRWAYLLCANIVSPMRVVSNPLIPNLSKYRRNSGCYSNWPPFIVFAVNEMALSVCCYKRWSYQQLHKTTLMITQLPWLTFAFIED